MDFIHKIFERSLEEAKRGDAASQYRIGKMYEYGIVPSQGCGETVTWYLKAARQGHTDTQYRMGRLFFQGKEVPRNYSKAAKWFRRAAEKGHAKAEGQLGFCYSKGKGVERNAVEAAKLWTRAADKGDIRALFQLGICYCKGKGVRRNASEAVKCFDQVRKKVSDRKVPLSEMKWLLHLEKEGNLEARYCLENNTNMYPGDRRRNRKVGHFEHKYFPLLREEAWQGHAEAQFQLAECYEKRNLVGWYDGRKWDLKSTRKALMWYLLAARQGHAPAQMRLAEHYETGTGVPQNAEMTLMWYTQAASQGDPEVLRKLHSMDLEELYGDGKTSPIDLKCLTAFAGLGNICAQYKLCEICEYGRFLPADSKKALEWYRILAERENIKEACLVGGLSDGDWSPVDEAYIFLKLGLFYLHGRGTEQNAEEAVRWFSKAAELESISAPYAQYELGNCYFKGLGVPQDKAKAFALFQQAAYAGHKAAQFQVARCYHTGEGAPRNTAYAWRWYTEVYRGETSYDSHKTDPSKCKEFLPAKYYSGTCYNKDSRHINPAVSAAEPAVKAGGEDAQALFNSGLALYCGDSAPRNVPEAVKQWLRAADLGYAPAQYMLGLCYEYGVCAGNSIRRVRRFLGLSRKKNADAGKDIKRALSLYMQAAEQGYAPAQYQLGCYHEGWEYDEDISLKWYHKAAEQGYAPAQDQLGSYYGIGHPGRDADPPLSVEWYRKAAEQEFPDAQKSLFYSYGYDLKDPDQALQWERRAAENGDAHAQLDLAKAYCFGKHPFSSKSVKIPVRQDYDESLKWLRKLAVRKDCSSLSFHSEIANAQILLGKFYYFGEGVRQDYTEAAKWFECALRSPENFEAGINLGLCCLFGDGVDQNDDYAADCINRNTSLWGREKDGNGTAQYLLGCLLLSDVGFSGVSPHRDNECEGEHLMVRAGWYEGVPEAFYRLGCLKVHNSDTGAADAFSNTDYVPAMYQLGACYQNGYEVETDEEMAVDLYRKTAETGYAPAIFSLGNCYFNGTGVAMNKKKAVQHYRKAASMGHTEAICALGICYYEASGVRKDIEKGVSLLRKAARRGSAEALFRLGYCYCQGIGLPYSPALGIKLYKRAAEKDPIAMYRLGEIYEEGYYEAGIAPDISKAIKLYRKAAKHGCLDAREKLSKFEEDPAEDDNRTDEDGEEEFGTS